MSLRKEDPGRFPQVLALAQIAYWLGRQLSSDGRWSVRPGGPGTCPKRRRPIDLVLARIRKEAEKADFTVPLNLGARWRAEERKILVAAYDLGLSDANEVFE